MNVSILNVLVFLSGYLTYGIVLVIITIGVVRWIDKRNKKGVKPRRRGLPRRIRTAILTRDGNDCTICGRNCCSPHIDHIKSVYDGGTDDLGNLRVTCRACNLSKGKRSDNPADKANNIA